MLPSRNGDQSETEADSGKESAPETSPGSYYYDDMTGYEIYRDEDDSQNDESHQAPQGSPKSRTLTAVEPHLQSASLESRPRSLI